MDFFMEGDVVVSKVIELKSEVSNTVVFD